MRPRLAAKCILARADLAFHAGGIARFAAGDAAHRGDRRLGMVDYGELLAHCAGTRVSGDGGRDGRVRVPRHGIAAALAMGLGDFGHDAPAVTRVCSRSSS